MVGAEILAFNSAGPTFNVVRLIGDRYLSPDCPPDCPKVMRYRLRFPVIDGVISGTEKRAVS